MTVESTSSSRRALLAGALGGLGAWAAGAIGRASPVRAEGENIVVGGDYATATSATSLTNQSNSLTVFRATSTAGGAGIVGESESWIGVQGSSTSFRGVSGGSSTGVGVKGASSSGVGVHGESFDATGVFGSSTDYVGVYGDSSNSNGVVGNNRSLNHAAVIGYSEVDGTGVEGVSGGGVAIPGKARTGVFGYAAQGPTSKGVWGRSPAGRAIQGTSGTGYAGYFEGRVFSTQFYELAEVATPAAPGSASRARLFIRDSAGKTQLCVRFHTGAVKVLATEA